MLGKHQALFPNFSVTYGFSKTYFIELQWLELLWNHENMFKLVGWLFWVLRPFETIFQSISGRLPKRGRKKRKDR